MKYDPSDEVINVAVTDVVSRDRGQRQMRGDCWLPDGPETDERSLLGCQVVQSCWKELPAATGQAE